METTTFEINISPKFKAYDIEILKKYFEYNKKYYWKINAELTAGLKEHPLWGPILKMQTPEQRLAQSERSLEMQRAAIYDGKWDEYTKDLMMQGKTYARMNVSYNDWYEIIKSYKDYLMPYIKKDFAHSTEEAVVYLDGMSRFLDYAMYSIAEAYFQEKNNIIKANEELFRAIFENSADNITLIDNHAIIKMINKVAAGFVKEDLIGKSILDIQSKENVAAVSEALHVVFEHKASTEFDLLLEEKEGEGMKYYSSSISPIFNDSDEVSMAVIISRDVSIQRLAHIQVRELNANLEKKVNERTEELRSSNKELEAFCYSISHDLRGPLRAINGFAEILLEDYSDNLSDEAKDSMNEIILNANKMGQLIDNLLEFSRLGKQEVMKNNIDMNGLVESIIAELNPQGKDNKVEFNVGVLEKVKGDRNMLKQVMINLISNAIKYSHKKKTPSIEVGFYKENENNIYYVKDNGAGFDMAYYNKLFNVFQRLHSAYEFEGTGVGLAIVHRIILKHGGRVWAEGKVGEGATFYISLPN
jgi:PAS domain S-box-containing protein